MFIVGKFKNGTITISNLKTEEGEYKCHFGFDINIKTKKISFTYNFGEVVFFNMYDFIDGKQTKLQDEDAIDNYLELNKEYFLITATQDGVTSNIKLDFDFYEDKDKLYDFLIELKAHCEVLMGN